MAQPQQLPKTFDAGPILDGPEVEQSDSKVIQKLQSVDVDYMTPRQVLELLWELKDLANK